MKMLILLSLLAVGLLLAAVPVGAAPSLGGYTGLLFVPTATALDQGEWNIAFFSLDLDEGSDSTVWAGNMGVAKDLELGVARIKFADHYWSNAETILNAKYRFQPPVGRKPALAVGVADITDEINTTPYVVMSEPLSRSQSKLNPYLHVGIGGGQLNGFFAGLTCNVWKVTLIAEYDTDNINLGARVPVGRGILVNAGWINGLDDFAIGGSLNKKF